jgi:hypothetical protein
MSQQSVLLTTSVADEGLARWDSATDRFDRDGPHHLQQVDQVDDNLALKADDVQQVDNDKTNHLPALGSTSNGPSPISGSPAASIRDSASTHSLPAVQVTGPGPQDSQSLSQTLDVPSLSDDDTPPVQRNVEPSSTAPQPSRRRSLRVRPNADVRVVVIAIFARTFAMNSILHRVDLLAVSPDFFRI